MKLDSKALLLSTFFLCTAVTGSAQEIIGNTGGLNIQTADMEEAGTFRGGLHFIGEGLIVPVTNPRDHRWEFGYNTFIYYLDFTVFDWLEVSLRETLLENFKNDRYRLREQDRSVSLKARVLKEGKYWPAIAVGLNDPTSVTGNHPYSSAFLAMTKHVHSAATFGTWSATVGYMYPWDESHMYDGFTVGLCYQPDWSMRTRLMVEYDTRGINYGFDALLWKHLGIYFMARESSAISAGIRYQTTIKYRKK